MQTENKEVPGNSLLRKNPTKRSSVDLKLVVEKFQKYDGMADITDGMVYPPTMIYLPSAELMQSLIERAIEAKKDPATGKYNLMF